MSNIQVNKLHTLTGHNDCIYALAEWGEKGLFFTGSGDGMVVQWGQANPKDGHLLARLPHSVYALGIDEKRGWLFAGHNYEGIHVIDLDTKKEIWSLKISSAAIFDLQVKGDNLMVCTGDGLVIIVDVEARAVVRHLKIGDKSARVMAFHPSGEDLAVGLSDHTVKVFDTSNFKPKANLTSHQNSVFALGYHPVSGQLVSGGRDAHLKIWQAETYEEKESIAAHLFAINYLSFRKDGRYFATCSMDKSIKLWDGESFRLLKVIDKARHAGHGTSINKVLWSSFSDKLISISDDRTVGIWEIGM
ncbi:WD40 repeat domain-containing protein [Litoribacter ruber]|uniref:WD40 repeat domain-containing protein n=1 Tax=Litoribacter ruber TaxID=702568 RepID=A0AAP2CJ72_9BACT|nr:MULTISPECIES: WD40 repeat domain-containing protein [Litoribacter]MBS9522762.1 WD40 repeat domain-containing protein [Litoribacter alkaliphilus]MBT0811260.1 WD40 repeat domain-containing protein [Litoribacter ruber]